MSNSSKKKVISICIVVAMMATLVIGATLAYFTDTDSATNTFKVGDKIAVELQEKSDPDEIEDKLPSGKTAEAGTAKTDSTTGKLIGYEYNYIPGGVYAKQASAVVSGGDAWLYMELTMPAKGWDALVQVVTAYNTAHPLAQIDVHDMVILGDGATVCATKDDDVKGTNHVVYSFGKVELEKAESKTVDMLYAVRIPDEFSDADIEAIGSTELEVKAYVVQADAGVTQADAYEIFFSDYQPYPAT